MVSGTISSNLRCGGSQIASRATRFLRRGGAVRHPHGLSWRARGSLSPARQIRRARKATLRCRRDCSARGVAVANAHSLPFRAWQPVSPGVSWHRCAPAIAPAWHYPGYPYSPVLVGAASWRERSGGRRDRQSWNRLDHRSPVGQDWGCGVLHGALGGPGGGPGSAAQASSATQEPAGEGQNRGKSSHCGGRLGRAVGLRAAEGPFRTSGIHRQRPAPCKIISRSSARFVRPNLGLHCVTLRCITKVHAHASLGHHAHDHAISRFGWLVGIRDFH